MSSPFDIGQYGYDPLQNNKAVMINTLGSAEGNPLAAPVIPSAQSTKIGLQGNPYGNSPHPSQWGLDESHFGDRDSNGNRVVNKAGLDAIQNHLNTFSLPNNTNLIGAGSGSQSAFDMMNSKGQAQGLDMSKSDAQPGEFQQKLKSNLESAATNGAVDNLKAGLNSAVSGALGKVAGKKALAGGAEGIDSVAAPATGILGELGPLALV
jgi:hypothetical protein